MQKVGRTCTEMLDLHPVISGIVGAHYNVSRINHGRTLQRDDVNKFRGTEAATLSSAKSIPNHIFRTHDFIRAY
jgi:hypothetical protein